MKQSKKKATDGRAIENAFFRFLAIDPSRKSRRNHRESGRYRPEVSLFKGHSLLIKPEKGLGGGENMKKVSFRGHFRAVYQRGSEERGVPQ